MVEIEVNDGRNGGLLFHPTGDRCRGRFDAAKVNAPELGTLPRDFPNGIPGVLIQFDPASGTGRIIDPLHDAAHAETRATCERRHKASNPLGGWLSFGTAVKTYEKADAATWLGWMRRAVAAGCAKLTKGKLPESDPPEMRKSFYSTPKVDPKDATINQLIGLLAAQLPDAKKKELAALLAPAK